MRPLTIGELLDAAVALLRTRPGWLLGAGGLLALAEQVALFPLRAAADLDLRLLPGTGRLPEFWTLFAVGFWTEPLVLGLLGAVGAAGAPRALLGSRAPAARRAALPMAAVGAALAATACGLCWVALPLSRVVGPVALVGLLAALAWPLLYGLVGLTAPAVVIDGVGPFAGLARSARLAGRGGLRAVWVRLLGGGSWLLVRVAFGLGVTALLDSLLTIPDTGWDRVLIGIAFLTINTIAYPLLACLDVVTHLDTRMRTEGLDIALRRTLARRVDASTVLATP